MSAEAAARTDKWYLGAGDGLIWAPPFPQFLHAPGFWDEAHLYQYEIRSPFTVSVLAGDAPLALVARRRAWTPAALTLDYAAGAVRARETRTTPGGGVLRSAWELTNATRRPLTLDVIAWTAVEGERLAAGDVAAPAPGAPLGFFRTVTDRHGVAARVQAALSLTPAARSWAACRAESSGPVLPDFAVTPFCDRWSPRHGLGGVLHLGGLTPHGWVFVGVHRRFRLPARGRVRFAAALALRLDLPTAAAPHPVRRAVRPRPFPAELPRFRCDDPYLESAWRYRWHGLRLNAIGGAVGNYRYPAVCEGIAYFHVPITYSAQCHVRELRWQADAEWPRGVIRTFFEHQQPDGALHGRIYANHLEHTDFYHADWGGAVEALDAVHPDAAFLGEIYPGLARYAEWLLTTRDAEASGMIDIVNHYETGQEYMSRYQAVRPDADREGWRSAMRLKGVDVTVYAYRLFRALERIAARLAPEDASRWRAAAERTAAAVRERMWDPAAGMFFDVDPVSGGRTGVKAAVCFYPYWTDLPGPEHLDGLGAHLFSPREFWTAYPAPSSAVDDPLFNPDAEWKGKRHNCPWNGRVWPMTNSHVAEALARVVRDARPEWGPKLGEFLRRFFRMMTFGGDPARPNGFEHYHPFTGVPSVYRGIDDYQHSWTNDLIASHVMGVQPRGAAGVTVHPLRLGFRRAELDGLTVAGRRLRVRLEAGRFTAWLDGRRAGGGRVGDALPIDF